MTISELICEILVQYAKTFGGGIPKTKLLKLAYLTEVKYMRRYSKRITETDWVYYLYGPYLWDYDEILKNKDIAVCNKDYKDDKEAQIITIKDNYHNANIPTEIRYLISNIVRDYGNLNLADILEYVYFETEPMINAEKRKETLDFNTVLSEDYYKVKELKIEPKTEKQIRNEFRKKVEALCGKGAY
jgi:uncharacterized phage-associated protein